MSESQAISKVDRKPFESSCGVSGVGGVANDPDENLQQPIADYRLVRLGHVFSSF